MTAKEVDDYLAGLPKEKGDTLEKLRKMIGAAALNAEEVITYRLPGYKYMGKPLVSYNATTNHCSFYVMSNTTLKGLRTSSRLTIRIRELSAFPSVGRYQPP